MSEKKLSHLKEKSGAYCILCQCILQQLFFKKISVSPSMGNVMSRKKSLRNDTGSRASLPGESVTCCGATLHTQVVQALPRPQARAHPGAPGGCLCLKADCIGLLPEMELEDNNSCCQFFSFAVLYDGTSQQLSVSPAN